MNRRRFFTNLIGAAAAFSILPAATTYARKWKFTAEKVWVPNPEWVTAEYEVSYIIPDEQRMMIPILHIRNEALIPIRKMIV